MNKNKLDKKECTRNFREEEAYRTLRTNLAFCGKNIKAIAITSCIPHEGKSTVSLKLSEVIAEAGKKVIVVDADMRKSVMISHLEIKAVAGLSHYLCGQKKIEEVICKTKFENMDIIFSGTYPPNPSELLVSSDFDILIEELKKSYDYVIIDTPPIGAVIDSAIISKVCDGYILIVEANKISYKFLKKIVLQLKKTNCRILGTVLNKVDKKTTSYYNEYSNMI